MNLMEMLSNPASRPVQATIFGEPGLGKTTLAATFPAPVFIRAEDGLQSLVGKEWAANVQGLPMVSGTASMVEQIAALAQQEHPFKTVVLDSITKFDTMLQAEVLAEDPKKPSTLGQAFGGYGKGYEKLAEKHRIIKSAFDRLMMERGMNIVVIAHSDVETLELPDSDPFQRHTLRIHKKSLSPWIDDVDVCGFIRLKMHTFGDGDRKKAVSDGTRELICYPVASNVSKNRFGITKPLEVKEGVNPLSQYISSLNK